MHNSETCNKLIVEVEELINKLPEEHQEVGWALLEMALGNVMGGVVSPRTLLIGLEAQEAAALKGMQLLDLARAELKEATNGSPRRR